MSDLSNEEIIEYINVYYHSYYILGIDPFRNSQPPREDSDLEEENE
jgi:hypothetical protein